MKDAQWLLEEKYGGNKSPEYAADLDRLAKGEPVAYVIGYQPFLGLKIYLDSKPLIPRPETEWWTEQLLANIQEREETGTKLGVNHGLAAQSDQFPLPVLGLSKMEIPLWCATNFSSAHEQPIKFLDLCAGSGAIGCAVLKHIPNAEVHFGEIDPTHEATILKNIRENSLDAKRAHIYVGDLFEPFNNMKFDFIAVNPPYIPSERELPLSVSDYEPALALYSGKDGLNLIRRIALKLPKHLNNGGQAWIECDSAHAAAACALFIKQGFKCEIRTDQYNAPRVLVVHPMR